MNTRNITTACQLIGAAAGAAWANAAVGSSASGRGRDAWQAEQRAHHRGLLEQSARQIVEGGVGLPYVDGGQHDGDEDDPDADHDADRRDAARDQRGRDEVAAEGDQQDESQVDPSTIADNVQASRLLDWQSCSKSGSRRIRSSLE